MMGHIFEQANQFWNRIQEQKKNTGKLILIINYGSNVNLNYKITQ
jgi:hypothetical protein